MTEKNSKTKRALVIVLDSAGIGELPDAQNYGDSGAATLPHIYDQVPDIHTPNLGALGLGHITPLRGLRADGPPEGCYGKMAERSAGKDTTTGHFELMGLELKHPFQTFPGGFPEELLGAFRQATGRGILGNKTASGTAIIEELGPEHLATGDWIVYTSADSVFQLAAHEERVPLAELYAACEKARALCDRYRIGRVIARPFVGQPGAFTRTYNRHDYSMPPSAPTVLDALQKRGVPVTGVGKIRDIFAGVGVDRSFATHGNAEGIEQTLALLKEQKTGLVFVNLVDFDMVYGHRRNAQGYARALEEFDRALPDIRAALTKDDLLFITADHGCDPTFLSHTDHTREYVPLLVASPRFSSGVPLGTRSSYADLGATVAQALSVPWDGAGKSFLDELPL